MRQLLHRLHSDEQGTVSIEYAILLGLVTIGVITAVSTIGAWVNDKFSTTAGALP